VQLGNVVKFVSVTNGDTGHHEMGGDPLARRRYREAQRAAEIADVEYEIYDFKNSEKKESSAQNSLFCTELHIAEEEHGRIV